MAAAKSPEQREQELRERLERIEALEREIKARERAVKAKEGAKKQIVLRLAPGLWDEIAAWAETISYEIPLSFTKRIPRVYVED